MTDNNSNDNKYINCSRCRCKYINDDEHIDQYFGYSRLGERFKNCTKCRVSSRNKSIEFHCVDEPAQQRVKISYSVNNAPRKHVRVRYAKYGCIDHIKDHMSEQMNNIREDHGLHRVNYTWDGLNFNESEQ